MRLNQSFDVIVVGAGHAGCEAAAASARMGAETLLLTHNLDTIGQMSCNPSIGGIGKSHLVKEVDALDGLMAKAADLATIHSRTLNERKGPAVRATRIQADRQLYRQAIRRLLDEQENLSLFQQAVDDLLVENDRVIGVLTQAGLSFYAKTVVLTAGTFLAGKIYLGQSQYASGRAGDPAAQSLAEKIRQLPFRVGRLKTGTPPRIAKNSIDFSQLEEQVGDIDAPYLSYYDRCQRPEQVSCFISHTNAQTHNIIREHLHESPMYQGVIEGIGPRYCPSIEDKIVRFAEKNSHQIFLEPEGLAINEIYPAGLSTSLPYAVQVEIINSMKGLEQARITRPGYAIEYDYIDPRDINPWLETKFIENLFFAGQINGTTGYEEAAAQGLLAGVNAALRANQKTPWYPRRDQAYLGVLIDDLVTVGTKEPYRMFTSRAEHRLLLRQDNADDRLTAIGHELGLVRPARMRDFEQRKKQKNQINQKFKTISIKPGTVIASELENRFGIVTDKCYSLLELTKRPEISYEVIASLFGDNLACYERTTVEKFLVEQKYAGYIKRQQLEIDNLKKYEEFRLPADMDYNYIKGLSNEVKEKLNAAKPATVGQASRIPGVTPAAVSLLLMHVKKNNNPPAERKSA